MLKNHREKLVIGVIGLGVGAFHLSNSLNYKNCKVKYICDINKKKLFYYISDRLPEGFSKREDHGFLSFSS